LIRKHGLDRRWSVTGRSRHCLFVENEVVEKQIISRSRKDWANKPG
jgi:hypothetical protein